MNAIENNAGKFLKDLRFFKGLEEADHEAFVSAARVREDRRQEQMLLQGAASDRLFVVLCGWVKLSRQTG